MRKEILMAVCAVGLLLPPVSSAESFLVENGVPNAEIVIAEDAVPLVRVSAEFLQSELEKMTGAKLPILTKPSDGETIQLFVGRSSFTDERGLDVNDLEHGGYHLKSGDGWLALLGRDQTFLSQRHESARELFKLLLHKRGSEEQTRLWQLWYKKTGEAWGLPYATFSKSWNKELEISNLDEQGTFNAVAGFLRSLGVRHYMPGPLGEVIPKRASIALPRVDETVRPDFPIRWANQIGHHFQGSNMDEKIWQLWMGFNRAADIQDATFAFHGSTALVENRTEKGLFAHPRAGEPKPEEMFAVYGGIRHDRKQCLSSEALFAANVKYVRALYDIFDAPMVSVMPADAFTSICQCNKCEGKDSPDRPLRGQLSNYVWDYVDRVAREVYKTHPDRKVVGMSYNTYRLAPTNLDKFSPNVVVSIVQGRSHFQQDPEAREIIHELRKEFLPLLGGDQARLMQDDHYRITDAVPGFYPRAIAEDLHSLKGISLGDFVDINRGGWQGIDPMMSIQHLNIYVTGRFWWDADQDIDALLDEFYKNIYGPAHEEMKTFVEYAEANWLGMTHDQEKIIRVGSLLQAARDKVPEESIYGKRLAFIAEWMAPLEYRGDQLSIQRKDVPEQRIAPNDGQKVVLDGKLDEPFWDVSGRCRGTMREVQTGRSSAFPTQFRVAWADNAIYFGIHCQDLPGKPANSTATKPDQASIWEGDCVEILLETQVHGYYQIAISPDGAIADLSWENGEREWKWKSHAQAATHIGEDSWTVEVRIPVAGEDRKEFDPWDGVAGTMPNDAFPWYFNVCRQRKRDNGQLNMAFSPTGKAGFHARERFAPLATGMRKGNPPPLESESKTQAGYLSIREKAAELLKEKNHKEALELFTQLAAREELTEAQRSDTEEQVVDCLIHLERYAEAEQTAEQISSEPVSHLCHMRLLNAQREGKQLIERYRDHDFSNWPDDRKGDAHLLRGTAAYFGRVDAELAKRDLEEALQYAVTLPSHEVAKRRIESYLERLTADR